MYASSLFPAFAVNGATDYSFQQSNDDYQSLSNSNIVIPVRTDFTSLPFEARFLVEKRVNIEPLSKATGHLLWEQGHALDAV
jgi:hypothetical protein